MHFQEQFYLDEPRFTLPQRVSRRVRQFLSFLRLL